MTDLLDAVNKMFGKSSLDNEPTFDDKWKPSEVFEAMRFGCEHLLIGPSFRGDCMHKDNQIKGPEWIECCFDNCPLLEHYAREHENDSL